MHLPSFPAAATYCHGCVLKPTVTVARKASPTLATEGCMNTCPDHHLNPGSGPLCASPVPWLAHVSAGRGHPCVLPGEDHSSCASTLPPPPPTRLLLSMASRNQCSGGALLCCLSPKLTHASHATSCALSHLLLRSVPSLSAAVSSRRLQW